MDVRQEVSEVKSPDGNGIVAVLIAANSPISSLIGKFLSCVVQRSYRCVVNAEVDRSREYAKVLFPEICPKLPIETSCPTKEVISVVFAPAGCVKRPIVKRIIAVPIRIFPTSIQVPLFLCVHGSVTNEDIFSYHLILKLHTRPLILLKWQQLDHLTRRLHEFPCWQQY